jgi:hypothetical protein
VFLAARRTPICDVPEMVKGNQPTDGGNLLLDDAEKDELLRREPEAEKWLRPFVGSDEFLNRKSRWCLWLVGVPSEEIRNMPLVSARVAAVKAMRLASAKLSTKKRAEFPMLFTEIRQTDKPYLLIPSVSSETRRFIPIGYLPPEVIASNLAFMLPNATLYEFGMLSSTMHNAWMRTTCGRLKSDYRYSNTIVYNNFPWPEKPNAKRRAAIEAAAQGVLNARTVDPSPLGDVYFYMPPELVKAHRVLDRVIDAAYGYKGEKNDAARVKYLFELHQKITSPLVPAAPAVPVKKSRAAKTSRAAAPKVRG